MSKSLKTTLLLLSFLILGFAVAGAVGVKAGTRDEGAYRQMGVFTEVLNKIRNEYVVEPNLGMVNDGALHGLLEALDANSSYLSPTEYKLYKEQAKPAAGIGATISKRYGYGDVVAVIPGGPADKAGLLAGDIIEAIDEKSAREMSLAEVVTLMGGKVGSVVNLGVVRAGKAQPQKITVTRDVVHYPAASMKVLDGQIGYIRAEGFPKGRAQEIAGLVRELQKNNVAKLILDLRNSGDGEVDEAIATANLFLNHGQIGYLEGQKFERQNFAADPVKAICNLPLLVLVGHSTAGPAELVAGAVLDNARGDVLGDKTFGSASVQKTIDLRDGGALILSVAKYYTPSGKAIQDVAITPNVLVAEKAEEYVPSDENELEPDENNNKPEVKPAPADEQLRRAIEQLTKPADKPVAKPAA